MFGAALLGAVLPLGAAFEAQAADSGARCQLSAGLWRRAADPVQAEYCGLVFLARARRTSDPAGAVLLSKRALALRNGGVLARVELGRALLASEEPLLAHQEFSELVAKHGDVVLQTLTAEELAAFGRAALLSEKYPEAARFYRASALLLKETSPTAEAVTLIEAATAVTFAEEDAGSEARAYLNNARMRNSPLLYPLIDALFVLSLARDGRIEQAKQRAESFESTWTLSWILQRTEGKTRKGEPRLPLGERERALFSLALFVEPSAAEEFRQLAREKSGPLPAHLKEKASDE